MRHTPCILNYWVLYYSVHLVELVGTGEHFAMKAMDKSIIFNRNKVPNIIFFS